MAGPETTRHLRSIDGDGTGETRRERNERRRRERAERAEREADRDVLRDLVAARLSAAERARPDEDEDSPDLWQRAQPLPPPAPTVGPARMRPRHWRGLAGFLALVVLPVVVVAFYMFTRAADQYVSELSFSVRNEDPASPLDLIGGLTRMSSGGSSDTDILHAFLQSPALVRAVNDDLDLATIWGRPEGDPLHAYRGGSAIEDLTAHWQRMVRVYYDASAQLIDLRVHAFAPADAQAVAQAVLTHSAALVNDLSAAARTDAIAYAQEDLANAEARLRDARVAITAFRNRNRLVDPAADAESRSGLVTLLQQQLAEAMIEHDMLTGTTGPDDPRIVNAQRRIDAIRARIDAERRSLGDEGADGPALGAALAEFERLSVDKEFAEQAYIAARAAYDAARAEAGRTTRYVAAHVPPTLPERATAPRRLSTVLVFGLFALLGWAVFTLVATALRDRR